MPPRGIFPALAAKNADTLDFRLYFNPRLNFSICATRDRETGVRYQIEKGLRAVTRVTAMIEGSPCEKLWLVVVKPPVDLSHSQIEKNYIYVYDWCSPSFGCVHVLRIYVYMRIEYVFILNSFVYFVHFILSVPLLF